MIGHFILIVFFFCFFFIVGGYLACCFHPSFFILHTLSSSDFSLPFYLVSFCSVR